MNLPTRATMLLQTPFHSRVAERCEINDWGNWMGYTCLLYTSDAADE